MNVPRPLLALTAALAVAGLTACTSAPSDAGATSASAGSDNGHGEIAGAQEVSEPPLALLSVDSAGAIGMLDLLDDTTADVGTTSTPSAVTSDGRYGFVTTADGLEIVDSGRWSWDHGDHFHYYLAEPRIVGMVSGVGSVTVISGLLSTAGSTGVFFAESGEAVLLDNAALSDGEISEVFRVDVGADAGIVAPLDDGAVVTDGDELVFLDRSGTATDATAPCVEPSGSITTRVGVVIGCAEGAVLATWDGSAPLFEKIAYPADADAPRAMSFDGRKGRPTVAAVAGSDGFWLLDTRQRTWQLVATEAPLARVTAVDDDETHVVAVDTEGRVRVYDGASGSELAVTDPLLSAVSPTVSLVVDAQRAYVNDPTAGVVHEIDYADAARVARSLDTPAAPHFFTEVGR